MEPYIGPPKLATYLHPSPTGPFLELNNEPLKPPSPVTSALLQHNPSLIDLCTLESCQRYRENSSSSSSSPFKPRVSIPSLYICSPSKIRLDYEEPLRESDPKPIFPLDQTGSPISSAGDCSPNVSSCSSTPYSSPKVRKLPHPSSPDVFEAKESCSKAFDEVYHPPEQHPNATNDFNRDFLLNKTNNRNELQSTLPVKSHTSPILHRLLTCPTQSNQNDFSDHERNQSPQYQPRCSPTYKGSKRIYEKKPTKSVSQTRVTKKSKSTRRSLDSPSSSHPAQQREPAISETDTLTSLLSVNTSVDVPLDETHVNLSSSSSSSAAASVTNLHKRELELSSSDNGSLKRQHVESVPTIVTQRNYCISYPANVSRCIDCSTANPADFAMHIAACRFQHCRTLKYYDDHTYETNGFTTSIEATPQDTEAFCTSNSSGQPPLNATDANYIFSNVAKLFCLMFLHEQTERLQHHEDVIWKRYMAGWREVCDDCSTTLFNYHYMCKQCGYMVCMECSDQYAQSSLDKRKKLKRLCTHDKSFCLSEFIPWKILLQLRNSSIDCSSRMQLDYTIKSYPSTKVDHLSMFIKSLKMKRSQYARDVQKSWKAEDCLHDPNIEFFCNGRLPVFNEWDSENAKQFFRKVWATSCPILVKRVHQNLSDKLWHPAAFKEHMIDHCEMPALWDCETLTPIQTNQTILSQFWDGFERLNVRLKDEENGGRPRILKLKDWPTKKDFASVFPTLLHDLMANIPFSDYTRRSYTYDNVAYHGGALNIVERLPPCLVKPDLGPKLYIAYSQLTSLATKKAGTTNLHIDVSDAVNILVYVGVGGQGDDALDKEEEIRQVEAEILDSNIDEAQLQRLRNGERPGALWHLFRADDARKIRDYIGRAQRKAAGSDSIHDQTAYLEKEDLDKLRDWSQVESYPMLQFLGDAVFIPSGAPHQVKNLHSCIKIAEDFVSPENLDRCLITTNEFRSLSKTHSNHADILQAKNILYYSTRDALHSLIESSTRDPSSSTESSSSHVHV